MHSRAGGCFWAMLSVVIGLSCGGSTETGPTTQAGGASGSGGSGGLAGAAGTAAGSGGTAGSGAKGGGAGFGGSANGGSGGTCESFVPCCDSTGQPVAPVCPGGGPPQCPQGSEWPDSSAGCQPISGTCSPQKPCSSTQTCDYHDNRCGLGEVGTCVDRPSTCDHSYVPVCACDGTVAPNECKAYFGGSDLDGKGNCTAPTGMFACGYSFCTAGQQYCRKVLSDVVGEPDAFECPELPVPCNKSPGCPCLTGAPCAEQCEMDGSGNLTVVCPGG